MENENFQQQQSQEYQQQQQQQTKAISIQKLDSLLVFKTPIIQPSKHSNKKFGSIKCFAANTHQGLVRNYNEDRVSIVYNITKPPEKTLNPNEKWPNCSFFGVYDGHGGKNCSKFLRDNLHLSIIKHKDFPSNPLNAIQCACKEIEEHFLNDAQKQQPADKSGSCANFIIIVDNVIYSCNIGDSRSLISLNGNIAQLTLDHKPEEINEKSRIISQGGQVYQSQGKLLGSQFNGAQVIGPHRVFPGGLSVSRTFGDVEAKIARLGGRPNVITAKPDIKQIQITTDLDYILLACDGIYDRMSNEEVSNCVKNPEQDNYVNIHQFAAGGVHKVLMTSLQKKSLDNVTVVLVGFKNFKTIFKYYQAQIKKTKFSLNNGYEEKKQNQSLFSQSSAQKLAQQESQKQNLLKKLIEKQKWLIFYFQSYQFQKLQLIMLFVILIEISSLQTINPNIQILQFFFFFEYIKNFLVIIIKIKFL